MNTKEIFKGKSFGFYVTLALIAATVVTAILYAVLYNGSRYFSMPAVLVMVAGAVAALAVALTKHAKWANVILALADFIGLLLYVYGIYFYVSIVMVGIQASTFSWQFILCTAIFVVLLVANVVNVFLEQVKEEEE